MAKKKKAQRLEPTKSTMSNKSGTQTGATPSKRKKKGDMRFKNMNVKQIFIFGAIALAMLAFILGPYIKNINSGNSTKPSSTVTKDNRPDPNIPEPQFRKDGELTFLSSDKKETIQNIDIEIVKDEAAIQQKHLHSLGYYFYQSQSSDCHHSKKYYSIFRKKSAFFAKCTVYCRSQCRLL